MLKDILTVEEFIITRLKNALYIAYTERVKNRIQNWIDSFPSGTEQNAKLLAQRTVLAQTWEALDNAYLLSSKSALTAQIKAKDDERDALLTSIRDITNGYARQTTDAEKRAAALKVQEIDQKYGIKTRERYEEEGLRLAQMVQEMEDDVQVEQALSRLGLTQMLQQLKAANNECRRLVDLRNQERSVQDKGQMAAARAEMDVQYPLTIKLINGLALVDENEHRYENLVRVLNEDIRYYKTVVLQKSEKADDEEGGDSEDDGGGSSDGGSSDSGSSEVTPVKPETTTE